MDDSLFVRYPELNSLRNLIPDHIIENEVLKHLEKFIYYKKLAKKKIPTVKLREIFPKELERGKILLENFLGHWGNASIEQVSKIALIVKFFRPKRVFEIGTYNGMTTLQLALNTPTDCRIYTLDLHPKHTGDTKYKLSLFDQYVASHFMKKFETRIGSYFKSHSAGKKITQLLGDSATFDFLPYFRSIDINYIDGAHDYQNKKNDSENALKMVRNNGVIIWDNYDDVINPDTTKYLYELSNQFPLWHLQGTRLVIYWNKK